MIERRDISQDEFLTKYNSFLQNKVSIASGSGIDIHIDQIHKVLFPHQRDITHWALKMGCCGVFGSWGLGKTLMQLEWARQINLKFNRPVLIGLPLGVRHEFYKDSKMLGIELAYAHDQKEAEQIFNDGKGLILCNYERIREAKYDPDFFVATSLDEASAIRSMDTKTTQYILSHLKRIKYRAVFTATPSPNAYHELLKYADFLGHMEISHALSRFFQRDSQKAHNSSLLPHREDDFWKWVHSWAVFISRPSDLGYDDAGYDLPEMKIHWHEVRKDSRESEIEKDGQIKMINDQVVRLDEASKEKRISMDARITKMKQIIDQNPEDHFLIWHHREKERDIIQKLLGPECRSVYGSQDWQQREQNLIDFSDGVFKYLSTKPTIAGQGCNFQYHCHKAIFVGIDDKFNDFIQAVHRIYRFMQNQPVDIHIIFTDLEHKIKKRLEAKWKRDTELKERMRALIQKYGLSGFSSEKTIRNLMTTREEVRGQNWTAIHNDSVYELSTWADNSIDLYHSSIPFSDLFEYAESHNDMGQSLGDKEFFAHMDFLTPNIYRTLKPGRICAIHVKDVIKYNYQNGVGFPTLHRFSDRVADHFEKHGFHLVSRRTVTTDVVTENKQTNRLGYTEMTKDGTKMGSGLPEYILVFRKPQTDRSRGYADQPVVKSKLEYRRSRWQLDAHGLWKSNGNRMLTREEMARMDLGDIMKWWTNYDIHNGYDFNNHSRLCEDLEQLGKLPTSFMVMPPRTEHPEVWDDIQRINTLNSDQVRKKLRKHVCPLQLDIIERIIELYTNPDDIVADPFAGIFSVVYQAVKMKRRGIGIELERNSFVDGIKHLRAIEYKMNIPTLFDLNEFKITDHGTKNHQSQTVS